MSASKGNISFAHSHFYTIFSRDISSVTTAADAAAMWAALKLLFPVGSYVNQANSVTLPVQTANTISVQNMGAEATAKLADLPDLSDAVVEVGWVNDNTVIKTLSTKTVGDDIAVCLLLNSDDAATKTNPLDDSTEATVALFSGTVASVEPVPPVPGTRAMVRVTIAADAKALLLDQA